MKKTNKIIWGIVLVIAGILLAVNSLGLADINIFFDGWWTLIIIIPCLIGFFTDGDKTGSLIGLAVGVVLLLCSQNIIDWDLVSKLIVPALVVIVGAKLIFGTFKSNKSNKVMSDVVSSGGNVRTATATFAGQDINYNGETFTGGDYNAIFGGINCDLRSAVIDKDCVIKVTAIFGGIDIFLPPNVNVKVNSNSFFGGISNKSNNGNTNSVTVYIEGTCLFGGVDIK